MAAELGKREDMPSALQPWAGRRIHQEYELSSIYRRHRHHQHQKAVGTEATSLRDSTPFGSERPVDGCAVVRGKLLEGRQNQYLQPRH